MKEDVRKMPCNPDCPDCKARLEEIRKDEETNLAVLVALVPVMVFTFVNMAGLV